MPSATGQPSRHRRIFFLGFDQGLVGIANIVVAFCLVFSLGMSGFGVYSIGWSVLLLAQMTLSSGYIGPVAASKLPATPPSEWLAGYLLVGVVLSVLFAVVGAVAYGVVGIFVGASVSWGVRELFFVFCITSLVHELCRRFMFMVNKEEALLIFDGAAYATRAICAAVLINTTGVTLSQVFFLFSLFNLAAVFGCILYTAKWLGWRSLMGTVRQLWSVARESGHRLFAFNFVSWISTNGLIYLVGRFSGLDVVGGINAARNFIGPLSLMIVLYENAIVHRAAKMYREAGMRAMRKFLKTLDFMAFPFLALVVLLSFSFGDDIFSLIYGPENSEYGLAFAFWSIWITAVFFQRRYITELRVLRSSRGLAFSSAIGVFIVLAGLVAFGPRIGVFSVALLASAQFGVLAALWWLLRKENDQRVDEKTTTS